MEESISHGHAIDPGDTNHHVQPNHQPHLQLIDNPMDPAQLSTLLWGFGLRMRLT
jgi:hypothetical protein